MMMANKGQLYGEKRNEKKTKTDQTQRMKERINEKAGSENRNLKLMNNLMNQVNTK